MLYCGLGRALEEAVLWPCDMFHGLLCIWGQLIYIMLVLGIEASKPPRFDLKSCQRHRNDPSVWRSVLVCPSKTKIWLNFQPKMQKSQFVWGNGLYQV